jgi:lipoprotein-anchoring transpeptidase ErfK/SrfK
MTGGRLAKAGILLVVAAGVVTAAAVLPDTLGANQSPSGAPQQDASSAPCRREPALIGKVAVDLVRAMTAPSPDADVVATFEKKNEQGARQVFLLEDHRVSSAGGRPWFLALLPVRPNGTRGYIPAADLRLAHTPYRLVVNRQALTLTLWDRCEQVKRYPIGLGTKETPTPVGNFYLTSLLRPPTPDSVYGSYAYGLSGYSRVIRSWRWGGLIGLHGTNDPSSVGKLSSHGCIRMRNKDIEELVRILPLGTPILIA